MRRKTPSTVPITAMSCPRSCSDERVGCNGFARRSVRGQAVTQATNDKHQLLPMITTIAQQAGDTPSQVLADAGYCSDENLAAIATTGIDAYISTRKQKHGERPRPCPRGPLPKTATRVERMTLEWQRWRVDLSKERLTPDTLAVLFAHARSVNLEQWISALFSGEKINLSEARPVLHTALRQQDDTPVDVQRA